jgi:integrase
MPKTAAELGPLAVSRLKKKGWNAVGGVSGLGLQITSSGARSWVLRIMVGGRRRSMGLGGFPTVGLAEARQKAREAREMVSKSVDPLLAKDKAKAALLAAQAIAVTFEDLAKQFIRSKESGWTNTKHAAQWTSSLNRYVFPIIGKKIVADIDENEVLRVLEAEPEIGKGSFWNTRTETASRVRQRIEAILDYATVRKLRQGENPARWKGRLASALPQRSKVKPVRHHSALKHKELPDFVAKLRHQNGQGALALEFLILTASRSGEVRGSVWKEVDLSQKLWIIPGVRMKSGREHRVPLCDRAIEILKGQKRGEAGSLIFPSSKATQLSDMTLTAVLKRMKVEVTAHGFRSTFRDWAAEETRYPNHVAEQALAHTIGDKVEAAYRRGDLLAQRREMMNDWAMFVESKAHPTP